MKRSPWNHGADCPACGEPCGVPVGAAMEPDTRVPPEDMRCGSCGERWQESSLRQLACAWWAAGAWEGVARAATSDALAWATRTAGDARRLHIDDHNLWVLLLNDVRYSLHRMSTAPSTCHDHLTRYARRLKRSQVAQIRAEILCELERAELSGKCVGMQCDHLQWEATARGLGDLLNQFESDGCGDE